MCWHKNCILKVKKSRTQYLVSGSFSEKMKSNARFKKRMKKGLKNLGSLWFLRKIFLAFSRQFPYTETMKWRKVVNRFIEMALFPTTYIGVRRLDFLEKRGSRGFAHPKTV